MKLVDRNCRSVAVVAFACMLVVGLTASAHAATFEWSNGGGDWLWSNSANWTNGATPTTGIDSLVFGTTGAGTVTNDLGTFLIQNNTMEVRDDYTIDGDPLSFDNWGDTASLTLTEGGGSDIQVNINTDVNFDNPIVTVPSGSLVVFNGIVSGGSHGVTFAGGGTVRAANSGNTITKGMWIKANTTLEMANSGAFGGAANYVGIAADNATLAYVGSGGDSINNNIFFNGGTGANGSTMIIANNSPDHGDFTLTTMEFTDTNGNPAYTLNTKFSGSSTGTTTINDILEDYKKQPGDWREKMALVIDSSGTLKLTSDNIYTGTTSIDAGVLLVNGVTADNGVVTVNSGGTLGGTGTVSGATAVLGGGRLSPGDGGVGTLTFTNSLDISGLAGNDGGDLLIDAETGTDQIILTTQALTIGSGLLGASDFTITGTIASDVVIIETSTAIVGSLDPADLTLPTGQSIALSGDGTDIMILGAPPAGTVISIQ